LSGRSRFRFSASVRVADAQFYHSFYFSRHQRSLTFITARRDPLLFGFNNTASEPIRNGRESSIVSRCCTHTLARWLALSLCLPWSLGAVACRIVSCPLLPGRTSNRLGVPALSCKCNKTRTRASGRTFIFVDDEEEACLSGTAASRRESRHCCDDHLVDPSPKTA
jgi:hypothetical protein